MKHLAGQATRVRHSCRKASRQRGSALIITLWVTATLSIMLGTVTLTVYSLNQTTVYQKDQTEADAWSLGALDVMQAELYAQRDLAAERQRGNQLGRWAICPPVTAAEPVRAARLWSPPDASGFDSPWAVVKLAPDTPLPGADTIWITAEVLAEDAKLPVNYLKSADQWDAVPNVAHTELAQAICDELTAGPFLCLEEMLQRVETLTPERYRGNADAAGLPDILTAFSLGSVYVNGASEQVLAAIPNLGPDLAHSIILRLKNPDNYFSTVDSLRNVDGMNQPTFNRVKPWFRVEPTYYRIRVSVCLNGIVLRREAVVYLSSSTSEMSVAWSQGG